MTALAKLRVLYHDVACTDPAAIATETVNGHGELIADLTHYGAPYAKVLAEAPAMLAALRLAREVLAEADENCGGGDTAYSEALDAVTTAIAAAEGGAK